MRDCPPTRSVSGSLALYPNLVAFSTALSPPPAPARRRPKPLFGCRPTFSSLDNRPLLFVANRNSVQQQQQQRTRLFFGRRRQDDNDNEEEEEEEEEENDGDILFSLVDALGTIGSTPTPGIPNLSIAYPLVLGIAAILLPVSTSIVLMALFAVFSYLGNRLVKQQQDEIENDVDDEQEDDVEEEKDFLSTNFAALGAAILSTGILAPPSSITTSTSTSTSTVTSLPPLMDTNNIVLPIVSIGALLVLVGIVAQGSQGLKRDGRDQRPSERIRMDAWDDQFEQQQQKRQQQQQRKKQQRKEKGTKKKP